MYTDAQTKGDTGEVITANALRNLCDMQIIRNLYIPNKDHLTEIDMIGVHSSGIYMFENKNYSGIVKGNINDKYWIVKYDLNYEKLFNPLMQNRIHGKCLVNYIKNYSIKEDLLLRDSIHSVVLFNNNASLDLSFSNKCIYNLDDFILKFINSRYKVIYSSEDIKIIVEFFRELSDCSDAKRELHKTLLKSRCSC
jgi:hypothetical protein